LKPFARIEIESADNLSPPLYRIIFLMSQGNINCAFPTRLVILVDSAAKLGAWGSQSYTRFRAHRNCTGVSSTAPGDLSTLEADLKKNLPK